MATSRFLFLAAVACSPTTSGRGARIEVSRKPMAEGFLRVGDVACRAEEPSTPAEGKRLCEEQLRDRAFSLEADVVVIEKETTGACTGCIEMKGAAFRRELPWERAAPQTQRQETFVQPGRIGSGTAFAIGPDGILLTAHHVVDGARTVSVTLGNGRHCVATLRSKFATSDLALLKVPAATEHYLPLAAPGTVQTGERVWTLGFPIVGVLGAEPKFTDGAVSALSGLDGELDFLQMTVPIQPGNSGGPLVTEGGSVVGVVTSSAAIRYFLRQTGTLPQGVNWAAKTDPVRLAYTPPSAQAGAISRAEAVHRARDALVYVESVEGDGLATATAGHWDRHVAKSMTAAAWKQLTARCDEEDSEACLGVARAVIADCATLPRNECPQEDRAWTLLQHACSTGRTDACESIRASGSPRGCAPPG